MLAERILHDALFLSMDLVSGKSLPLLIGITRLPMDQLLACLVVSLGVMAGTLYSVYAVRRTPPDHPLVVWNGRAQSGFSLFITLSTVLAVARMIHYERGIILSLIPAFCVLNQPLPLKDSAFLVMFLLVAFLHHYCMTVPAPAGMTVDDGDFLLPSVLRGLNPDRPNEGMLGVLGRVFDLFVLAFYASVQHLPAQHRLSYDYARRDGYALMVSLLSAWGRIFVYWGVCFFQDNAMHVMLENDLSRGQPSGLSCVFFTVILLYSACATASLLREDLPMLDQQGKIKLFAVILALAALFRNRESLLLFRLTWGVTGLSLLAVGATLGPWQ